MLEGYKEWVRRHPGVVQNLDWLLYLPVWNPARLGSSETSYEVYHTAVGLLSLWHQHVIDEPSQEEAGEDSKKRARRALWLDALEQMETLIELRAIHMEQLGKMSRYSPLLVLETAKALLKMAMWVQFPGHLFLRRPSTQDLDQFESEQGVSDISAALQRLHARYTRQPSPQQLLAQQQEALLLLAPPAPTVPAPGQHWTALPSVAEHGPDSSASSNHDGEIQIDYRHSKGAPTATAALHSNGSTHTTSALNGSSHHSADTSASSVSSAQAVGLLSDPRVLIHRGLYSLFTTLGINSPAGSDSIHINGVTAVGPQQALLEPDGSCCTACAASAAQGKGQCGGAAKCSCACHQQAKLQHQQQKGSHSTVTLHATGIHHVGPQEGGWSHAAAAWLAAAAGLGSSSISHSGISVSGASDGVDGDDTTDAAADAEERLGNKALEAAAAAAAAAAAREHHMGVNLVWLSQMLYIWRPVLYVSLLRRHGRMSWRPWSISLAIDLLSIHFQGRGRAHLERAAASLLLQQQGILPGMQGVGGSAGQQVPRLPRPSSLLSVALMRGLQQAQLSQGEQMELLARKQRLFLYLMRGPVLDIWIKRLVLGVRNRSKRVPGMAFAFDYLYGTLDTFCGYYTYTA